jgi:hypothetical protein
MCWFDLDIELDCKKGEQRILVEGLAFRHSS